MANVTKLSVGYLIGLFIGYVAIHIGIGLWLRHLTNKKDTNSATDDELKMFKVANFLMKWFPAIYVLFVLVVL